MTSASARAAAGNGHGPVFCWLFMALQEHRQSLERAQLRIAKLKESL